MNTGNKDKLNVLIDRINEIVKNPNHFKHPLHKIIGSILKHTLSDKGTVILDKACDDKSKHNIPLFLEKEKSNATEITNVDALYHDRNYNVKLICEIEESDRTPIRIYGKYFSAAQKAKYWKREFNNTINNEKLEKLKKHDNFLFLQILKNFENSKSNKPKQWTKIMKSINARYIIIYGSLNDFKVGEKAYKELLVELNKI